MSRDPDRVSAVRMKPGHQPRSGLCRVGKTLLLFLLPLALLSGCETRRTSRKGWINGSKAWAAQVWQAKNDEWVKREADYFDAVRSLH